MDNNKSTNNDFFHVDKRRTSVEITEDKIETAEMFKNTLNDMRIEELEDKIALYTAELNELRNETLIENKENN